MKTNLRMRSMLALTALIFFSLFVLMESSAWARAGGGRSSGSRGSRSFSAPSSPSSPSPSSPYSSPKSGLSGPGSGTSPGSTGTFGRSPFLQGLAGGVAGGFLGNLLFGGRGYASGMGGTGGGGIGFLDILILGVLGYFAWRFFKRRRQMADAGAYYADTGSLRTEGSFSSPAPSYPQEQTGYSSHDDVQKGLYQIGQFDSSFTEEAFKETAQDLFFRIQAGWMNRSLDGIQPLLDNQMAEYFTGEFNQMKQNGRINRLENIAVRKVEVTEAWQETGKEYITVLLTANLLDYTVDDKTGQVLEGDKLNPVKFQEFWTFCRDIGSSGSQWRLSAINQMK